MPAPTELAALMTLISESFPFTQNRYPNGDLSTPEKTRAFAVRHSHAHMSKTTGQIATIVESYDHGGWSNEERVKAATLKAVINALNLAHALGMTAQEITEGIPKILSSY